MAVFYNEAKGIHGSLTGSIISFPVEVADNYNLKLKGQSGFKFNPLLDSWNLTNDKSVNYIVNLRKI